MAVLKLDETPYEIVREGLQRKIIHTEGLMTVLIDFTDGPWEEREPPHSHPHEQTSYVAEGEIIFYCEDEPDQHLKAGDIAQWNHQNYSRQWAGETWVTHHQFQADSPGWSDTT